MTQTSESEKECERQWLRRARKIADLKVLKINLLLKAKDDSNEGESKGKKRFTRRFENSTQMERETSIW